MHFMDSIFIFGLALILFGPKKLPEIGRQIGKIVLEFRKASNEFKMQIEDELRSAEQAERQQKIAAETAALTAGVLPVPAIPAVTETSTPTALTVQPPSSGEQVSTDPPNRLPYGVDAEPLADVIVESPGENPNTDAIAEIYPSSEATPDPMRPIDAIPAPQIASAFAEYTTPKYPEFGPLNPKFLPGNHAEPVPETSDSLPVPPDRHTTDGPPPRLAELEGHLTDQATTNHG